MIKFRSWIETGNETDDYVEPMTIQQMIHSKESTFSLEQLNDLVDFEQFTGLTDANGKQIYEGDIVHVVTGDGYRRTGKVIFEQEQGCYMVDNGLDKYPFNRLGYERDTLEVLGNVHTNPELLEENK
ncbi:prophage Lp1 protein 30 [Lactobacillus phage Lb338-1]|jgi:uncharacterized phage protein (TIGR01671 family)|uniref:Prophage Lp1 protein 30 n=1 Tax=Lactobacillus phage Lb338-1 TaxID=2892342 RepID=C1KFE9_9CAUD|nr:prophage Lp1 protein 30 [Lactobacillus phage Lb338-1]ACO36960.1 prophage Lp1 protein 30 [Lactobacillus phage Lb338-1]